MKKKKFFITTTVSISLSFFKGQCSQLNNIYDVCAISTPSPDLISFAKSEGIKYKGLKMEREISLFSDLIALCRWLGLLFLQRPYLVHANTPKASLLAMIASWVTFRPIRIYMCHGLRYQGCTGIKRKILTWMERITCFCANHVICVSQGIQEQLAEDRICPLKKSQVILNGSANGVDTDWFNPDLINENTIKDQYGIKKGDIVVVFIGRIVRDKGIEELIDVTISLHKENMPIKLLIVGGRENNLDALSQCTENKIAENDYIIECGRQKDVRPFIKAATMLILPSYREGFGQVLIEANSLGIPVIASNIIGCKNIIVEGTNGLLCAPHNFQSLYETIMTLLTNTELYNSMKKKCRPYVINKFDRKKVSKAYVEYYSSLIKNEPY